MNAHIQIVGWNHRVHLWECLASCVRQTVRAPVLYIDNASSDGSAELVRSQFPDVAVHVNAINRGYAGGHNDGLRIVPKSDVAILLNPDIVLEDTFVEEILKGFSEARVGAVVPLLFRKLETGNWKLGTQPIVIDAYGTKLLPSLRAVNQYEGDTCSPQIPNSKFQIPVWGFSGAAVALRRTALTEIAINGEVFDEDLFSYREDVDCSWRLQNRRWKSIGWPSARATHVRSVRKGERRPPRLAQLSWRNYFLVLAKSVPVSVLVRHSPFVLLETVARLAQLLVHPGLWSAAPELLWLLPRMFKKRAAAVS